MKNLHQKLALNRTRVSGTRNFQTCTTDQSKKTTIQFWSSASVQVSCTCLLSVCHPCNKTDSVDDGANHSSVLLFSATLDNRFSCRLVPCLCQKSSFLVFHAVVSLLFALRVQSLAESHVLSTNWRCVMMWIKQRYSRSSSFVTMLRSTDLVHLAPDPHLDRFICLILVASLSQIQFTLRDE